MTKLTSWCIVGLFGSFNVPPFIRSLWLLRQSTQLGRIKLCEVMPDFFHGCQEYNICIYVEQVIYISQNFLQINQIRTTRPHQVDCPEITQQLAYRSSDLWYRWPLSQVRLFCSIQTDESYIIKSFADIAPILLIGHTCIPSKQLKVE